MKKRLLFLYFISCTLFLQAQPWDTEKSNVRNSRNILMDEFMSKIAKASVSDYLYFEDDAEKHLINNSPLSFFPWKEKAFDKFSEIQMAEYRPLYGGLLGHSGKYNIIWLVKNKKLYMSDLHLYTADLKPEHIKHIEKLTGRKFNRSYADADSKTPIGEYGILPATWFTDTLYVKKIRKPKDDIDVWKMKPYKQLIFEKGELVSIKEIFNKTWYVKIN